MTPEKPLNPRSITDDEAPWIEACKTDPAATHNVLFEAITDQVSAEMARNVWSYVSTRAFGKDPRVSQTVKVGYRKILAQLADEGVTPPPPRGMRPEVVIPPAYDGARSSAGADGGSIRSTSASGSAVRAELTPGMAAMVDALARRRELARLRELKLARRRSATVTHDIPGLVKLPVHADLPVAA